MAVEGGVENLANNLFGFDTLAYLDTCDDSADTAESKEGSSAETAKTAETSDATTASTTSFESIYDKFMSTYGTQDNYQRSFGGVAAVEDPTMSDKGEVSFSFSRPIVYPKELL